jgi:hypothetical protein
MVSRPRNFTIRAKRHRTEQALTQLLSFTELSSDPTIRSHLAALYDTLLEQNLLRIIEPYSVVEIVKVAELVGQDQQAVEAKFVCFFSSSGFAFPWFHLVASSCCSTSITASPLHRVVSCTFSFVLWPPSLLPVFVPGHRRGVPSSWRLFSLPTISCDSSVAIRLYD